MVGVPYNPLGASTPKPNGPNRTQKRDRYKPVASTPLVDTNERAYENPLGDRRFRDTYGENILTGGIDNFSNATSQLQSNVISGALQIPGDIAGMADLVRVGGGAAINAVQDDATDDNYFQRLGRKFTEGVISPEAQAELADDLSLKADEYVRGNPAATEEQLNDFLRSYQDSEEFFDLMTTKLSPGFRLAQQGNKWANEVAGLGKRPDQQTVVDDLQQMLGGTIIGIPKSVADGIMTQARKRLSSAVIDNAATQALLKVGEIASPITFPLTPGNVAANVAVGGAITEATRVATGQPSLINGGVAEWSEQELDEVPELIDLTHDDDDTLPVAMVEPADGHGTNIYGQSSQAAAGTAAILGVLGFPAIRAGIRNAATQRAQQVINGIDPYSGKSLAQGAGDLEPLLSPVAGVLDTQAPAVKGANKFDLLPQYRGIDKSKLLDTIDANLSMASPTNVHTHITNNVNFGILPDHKETTPLIKIRNAVNSLPPPEQELLTQYGFAVQRKQDRTYKMQSAQQKVNDLNVGLRADLARGDTRSANIKRQQIQETLADISNINADTPETRNFMRGLSDSDVDTIIRAAEANPALKAVADLQRRSGHDLLNFSVAKGLRSSEEATILAMNRDWYFPIKEAKYADLLSTTQADGVTPKTGTQTAIDAVKRKSLLFKDRLVGKTKTETGYLSNSAVRNLETRDNAVVNQPVNPQNSLEMAWADAIKEAVDNDARKKYVDIVKMLDGADGKLFEQYNRNGRKQFSQDEYFNPNTGIREAIENSRHPYTTVLRNGKMEFYKWSDPSISYALEFAPLSSVPVLNQTRKMWQAGTTGKFAPWFSVKSAIWDPQVARLNLKSGRAFGELETFARRLFIGNQGMQNIIDQIPLPSGTISAWARMPYTLSARAVRAMGHKVADDLELNSGFFNSISKVVGRKPIEDLGTGLVKAFDRTTENVFTRNMSTTMGSLQENTRIADDFATAKGRAGPITETRRNLFKGWDAIIESLQNSTRMSFFAQNYSLLKQKHGGKVPKGELDLLVKDTRDLLGDASKYSNSKFVQGTTSIIPYSNIAMQATRELVSSAVRTKGNRFISQFVGGTVLPTLGIYSMMEDWQGALDYWENNAPEWRQLSGIPIPSGDAIVQRLTTGTWPEFTPEMLNVYEIPAEQQLLLNPILAGLRQLGLIKSFRTTVNPSFPQAVGNSLAGMFNLAATPAVDLIGAITGQNIDLMGMRITPVRDRTFGGANADMINPDSDISQQLYDIVGSLTGGAGQIVMQTFDVFDQASEEGDEFGEAFSKAMETTKFEVGKRIPDVPAIFGNTTREYVGTPSSDYVYDTTRVLEPIIGQQSVETDSLDRGEMIEALGLSPINKIKDPLLKEVSQIVYNVVNKKDGANALGKDWSFKWATTEYSNFNATKTWLERDRNVMAPDAYQSALNGFTREQQQLREIQAVELQDLLARLQTEVGPIFEEVYGVPFNYGTLAELVRKDVGD